MWITVDPQAFRLAGEAALWKAFRDEDGRIGVMMNFSRHPRTDAPRQRWDLLEAGYGDRIRTGDATWARGLSAAERIGLVEELLGAARAAHESAGDWAAVEAAAWAETLAERRRLVAAFHRLDEVMRGSAPVADAG